MISPQQNKYLQTAVQTASPAQLMMMLFDGAIRFCKMGMDAIHKAEYEEANKHLCRAQDIIQEFIITLRPEYEVSGSMAQLYDYFIHQLIQANIKKEVAPVEEVTGYLRELKETWMQASKMAQSQTESPQPTFTEQGV